MQKKRGRKTGSWTKWPPERFEQALNLIRSGYNYTQAAEAVGAKRHELTARLIQTNQYIRIRELRPPKWEIINTAPQDGTRFLAFCQPKDDEHELFHVIYWEKNIGWCLNDGYFTKVTPTHWMQLPEQPK